MRDTEEPPTKMSKFDEMSQTYTQEEEMEGHEEWLSEELLTDEDGATTTEQERNDTAVADNSVVSQDNINLSSNNARSKLEHSNIEEVLNNMDSDQDDLPDDLNTFLVMKKGNKTDKLPVATQDESDGNDTDDLLRLLEDDVKKTTKKVKVNASAKEKENNKKADTETSCDEDDFVFKGGSSKQLRIAQSVLKKQPASKAVPEESSDEDDNASTDKPVRRVKVARRPGNYAAKSTSKPQKPVRITRNSSNGSRNQSPTPTNKNSTHTPKNPTQTSKNSTQTSKNPTKTPKNPTKTPKNPTKTITQPPKNPTQARNQPVRTYSSIAKNKSAALQTKNVSPNHTVMKTIFKIGSDVTVKMNAASPVKQYTNNNIRKSILKPSPMSKPVDKPVDQSVKWINKDTVIKKVVTNKNVKVSEPSKVKPRAEPDEIIDEDEFLEDEDFDLNEEFADESDTELDKRAIKQRIMKPEELDEEMLTDVDSNTEDDSLLDDLSSTDSEMDDWFTLDIRDERAGEYLPLLGCRALELLLGEKKRMANRVETLKQSLESLSNSARIQANKIRSAKSNLAEIEDLIKVA